MTLNIHPRQIIFSKQRARHETLKQQRWQLQIKEGHVDLIEKPSNTLEIGSLSTFLSRVMPTTVKTFQSWVQWASSKYIHVQQRKYKNMVTSLALNACCKYLQHRKWNTEMKLQTGRVTGLPGKWVVLFVCCKWEMSFSSSRLSSPHHHHRHHHY